MRCMWKKNPILSGKRGVAIMSKDSFAKKHLEKYGWRNGQGLGKQESGMIDPIKPKLKFDTAGIGHDAGEQFSFHWWDHVFNKAAKNIQVQNCEDGVEVKQKGVKTKLISNKKTSSTVKEKSLLYGSFVKHGTLKPDGLISRDDAPSSPSSDDSDDEDCPPVSYEGNDEKLYKACGGRTAHKGARHGLHLSGKLRRIEEQDRIENEVLQRSAEQQQTNEKRKKKKRDWKEGGGDGMVQKEEGGAEEVENGPHPGVESRNGGNLLGHETEKPKGNKSKKRESENAEKCNHRDIEDVTIHVKKSKKKKKKVVEQDTTAEESDSNELEGKTRRKDRSTERSKVFHKDCEVQDVSGSDDRKRTKSKKRNKKMKGEREEVDPETESGPVTAGDTSLAGDGNAISSSRIPELDDDMKNCSQEKKKKKKKKKRKNVEAEDDSSSSDSRKASHTKELDLEREDGDGSKNRKKRKHQTEERLAGVDEGGAIPLQVNGVSEQQGSKKSKKSKKKKSKERRD